MSKDSRIQKEELTIPTVIGAGTKQVQHLALGEYSKIWLTSLYIN
jgi:hypothetical protein